MLRPVGTGACVVACSTCRLPGSDGKGAPRAGTLLAEALRRVQASDPALAGVTVDTMPCLFACEAGCTVHVGQAGKIGYVLGRFAADDDAARAILEYAVAYADTAEGQVPYRAWPEGVKGHFLVRVPPAGFAVA